MPDALAERGLDWQAQIETVAQFLAVCDEKKVVLDTDPRRAAQGGAALQQSDPAADQSDATNATDSSPKK